MGKIHRVMGIQSCEAQLAADTAVHEGSVIQQLQQVGERAWLRNREAIKSLIHCTHLLTLNCIAHTTTFGDLVDLVVSCGGEVLRQYIKTLEKMPHAHPKMQSLNLL